ncbi:MAG: carotenoid biosynthesis protein [Actinomycetes bacterium]|jgi:putative membrane protein
MSLRQFYPRRNRRRDIATWKIFMLYFTTAVAILLQISYPLISGEPLRLVTIATVYWAAAAMCIHAWLAFGVTYALIFPSITLTYAFVVEQIGSKTGWPFGTYEYSGSLGYQVFGVPLVVPFAWVMLAHPLLIAARKVSKNWVFLYGGIGMMAWDLFLDPQMVAGGRWKWEFTGRHVPLQPDIPISNAVGWLLTGMGLMAILHRVLQNDRRKIGTTTTIPDFFLFWTWFAGVVGNLFFFDRPGTALIGGVVLGLVILPYVFLLRFGPPVNF